MDHRKGPGCVIDGVLGGSQRGPLVDRRGGRCGSQRESWGITEGNLDVSPRGSLVDHKGDHWLFTKGVQCGS